MLEAGEAPMGTINGIVDEYIREAKAFWSGKGGQLDFDTYVRDKLKSQPRYKTVFKHKLPGTTEEAFLNEYLGRISQFGMGDQFNQEQGFAAVTSGAAPIEQVKRVSRTREVQNSGGFSQRLAQTIKGLGIT
jgi:predicted NUDIX family phosphoesterase